MRSICRPISSMDFPFVPIPPYRSQTLLFLLLLSYISSFPISSAISELSSSFIFSSSSSFHSDSQVSYSDHCSHIVPESTQAGRYTYARTFLGLRNIHLLGGQQFLGPPGSQISVHFWRNGVFRTQNPEIFKIEGILYIKVSRILGNSTVRSLFRVYGGNRFPRSQRRAQFLLWGYWSASSGKLCMVGSWRKESPLNAGNPLISNVVFKLNYPNTSNIHTCLITGRLESLASEGSDAYFKPISILDFSRMNYDYSLVKPADGAAASANNGDDKDNYYEDCAGFISLSDRFRLVYGGSCEGHGCKLLNGTLGFLPNFMSIIPLECLNKPSTRALIVFSNTTSTPHNGLIEPYDPHSTLLAEGAWDENRKLLSLAACRIFMDPAGNASVRDCSIGLNFTLISVLSIRSRSLVLGQIWSNKGSGEDGYFDRVGIRSSEPKRLVLPKVTYEYTEIERARTYCVEKSTTDKRKGKYPNAYSLDMKFSMLVKNNQRQIIRGNAIPLFVNDRVALVPARTLGVGHYVSWSSKTDAIANGSLYNLVNMSYLISFKPSPEVKLGGKSFSIMGVDISAEGIYDTQTGILCMAGCWNREADGERIVLNSSKEVDCDIFIKIQFPSDSVGVPKGTIESKRQNSDPLFFQQLELFGISITERQADRTFWRMDLEIIMVLVSNTLACIFLGLQLLHVKKHPESLPFISVVMLIILTLGHMIPLLLNFDAFLTNRKKQHVFYGNGQLLEVNEVVVRVITMVAFLLECCLLQLTWSSRKGSQDQKLLWSSEKKVAYLFLPLCIVGALIAWFVHPWESANQRQFFMRFHHRGERISQWGNLKAYAGLILDAFLLPQIIFNFLSHSNQKALVPTYYFGTTIVRLLPHAYDLFRAHSSALKFDLWYIYANPKMNYYSTSWDIIISVCGVVFAVLIYLQQRFGGQYIVPSRLKLRGGYEKVPVTMNTS